MLSIQDVEQLAGWLEHAKGHGFDIILAGRVFGGRSGESPQQPEAYILTDDGFILHFGGACEYVSTALDGTKHVRREGGTERLEIIRPSGVSSGPDGALLVATAAEARFGWHFYGRPQTPENWCVHVYTRDGEEIEYNVTGPIRTWYRVPLPERFRAPDGPFIRLASL